MKNYPVICALVSSAFMITQMQNVYTKPEEDMNNKDTSKFEKLFAIALNGDMKSVLAFLDTLDETALTDRQKEIRDKYYRRFRDMNEDYVFKISDPDIISLNKTYLNYWRESLLNNSAIENYDSMLTGSMTEFLKKNHRDFSGKSGQDLRDNFPQYLQEYLSGKGIYSATGKTGKLFDLLMHAKETEIVYDVTTPEDTIKVKVVFMEDILSNGWEDYATFGRYYPGGWATSDALYCVKESYDLNSENFLISYLKHEGKHFADYKLFPKLTGADLEYRAKLVELAEAKTTLFNLIKFFCVNSYYERQNPHGFANYCVIRDLSGMVFGSDIVTDSDKWEKVPPETINQNAIILLKKNTVELKKAGAETVTGVIK